MIGSGEMVVTDRFRDLCEIPHRYGVAMDIGQLAPSFIVTSRTLRRAYTNTRDGQGIWWYHFNKRPSQA
jgi:hypothetical protein